MIKRLRRSSPQLKNRQNHTDSSTFPFSFDQHEWVTDVWGRKALENMSVTSQGQNCQYDFHTSFSDDDNDDDETDVDSLSSSNSTSTNSTYDDDTDNEDKRFFNSIFKLSPSSSDSSNDSSASYSTTSSSTRSSDSTDSTNNITSFWATAFDFSRKASNDGKDEVKQSRIRTFKNQIFLKKKNVVHVDSDSDLSISTSASDDSLSIQSSIASSESSSVNSTSANDKYAVPHTLDGFFSSNPRKKVFDLSKLQNHPPGNNTIDKRQQSKQKDDMPVQYCSIIPTNNVRNHDYQPKDFVEKKKKITLCKFMEKNKSESLEMDSETENNFIFDPFGLYSISSEDGQDDDDDDDSNLTTSDDEYEETRRNRIPCFQNIIGDKNVIQDAKSIENQRNGNFLIRGGCIGSMISHTKNNNNVMKEDPNHLTSCYDSFIPATKNIDPNSNKKLRTPSCMSRLISPRRKNEINE
jgi:hypothetical protein